MKVRKNLSRKIRFEVFKRDSFTCLYCGRKAPDVVLEIDHVKPVSGGGTNDILNLVTSCRECNSGKSNRHLSDNTVIEKQRNQLEELQCRKEQIEMLFDWKKGLLALDDQIVQEISDFWSSLVRGYSLNDNGLKSLRKLLKKFSVEEIMDAIRIAVDQYLEYEKDNEQPLHKSVELAWDKIGGICTIKRREKDRPYLDDLRYIRGILRNRLRYVDEGYALELMEQAAVLGATIESLKKLAVVAERWDDWRYEMENFIQERKSAGSLIEIQNEP